MVDVLVVGADGLIGSALMERLPQQGLTVRGTSRRHECTPELYLDLADEPATWQLPAVIKSAVICAGIVNVVGCERQPQATRKINVERTCLLIDQLQRRGAKVLYLSSNIVFSGDTPRVAADCLPDPRCEYGRQKVAVERYLEDRDCGFQVLRLGKVVEGAMEIASHWAETAAEGGVVTPFADFYFSPVPLSLVTSVIAGLLDKKLQGIFHLTARDEVSYLQLANHWAERHPEVVVKATRADSIPELNFFSRQYAALDCNVLVEAQGIELPLSASMLDEMVSD
ncbi:MAG: sugar nucleotide-binding protein [Sedimenticola sp.]